MKSFSGKTTLTVLLNKEKNFKISIPSLLFNNPLVKPYYMDVYVKSVTLKLNNNFYRLPFDILCSYFNSTIAKGELKLDNKFLKFKFRVGMDSYSFAFETESDFIIGVELFVYYKVNYRYLNKLGDKKKIFITNTEDESTIFLEDMVEKFDRMNKLIDESQEDLEDYYDEEDEYIEESSKNREYYYVKGDGNMGIVFEDDDGEEQYFEEYEYYGSRNNNKTVYAREPKYANFLEELKMVKLFIQNTLNNSNQTEEERKIELIRVYEYIKTLLYEIKVEVFKSSPYVKYNYKNLDYFISNINDIYDAIDKVITSYDKYNEGALRVNLSKLINMMVM